MAKFVNLDKVAPRAIEAGAVAVGVSAEGKLGEVGKALNKALDGRLKDAAGSGDLGSKPGSCLLVQAGGKTAAERVLLVRLGPKAETSGKIVAAAAKAAAAFLSGSTGAESAVFAVDFEICDGSVGDAVEAAVSGIGEGLYRYDAMRSKAEKPKLAQMSVAARDSESVREGVKRGSVLAEAVSFAKDLANAPSNVCTPTLLAEAAVKGAEKLGIAAKVLGPKQIEALKMGSFLSVAKGSKEEARLIEMSWNGGPKGQRPIVLVGKGITFDSGGISLKPGEAMDEMKFDMCGAASVIAAVRAAAALKLPLNVVAIVPACENMPDAGASKPGDVVKTMDGQTVEILNTDAEGRLILCDAIAYAKKLNPSAIVDVATLTGACVVALGQEATGLFSNDDELAAKLAAAGEASRDRAWRMPMWDEYQDLLKSAVADMGNIGGRYAGSITAACFLSRFAKDVRWAHLDVAGTAWRDKKGTGRPVPLLLAFLEAEARGE